MASEKRLLFKFYSSYYDIATELNDKDRLAFYDALMKRQFTGVEPQLNGMAKFAYISQKHSIDKQIEGWEFKMKTVLNSPIEGGGVGGIEGGSTQEEVEEKEEEKEKEKYNYTLFEIKNFNVAVSEFEGNKQYFYLAYRYWELWKKEFPNHRHLKSAKVQDWYDAVRLMVERDEQTVDRLVAIYIFLSKCQAKDKGYETFLFSQVKSLPALRKNTNSGEYRLDNLAAQVNEKLEKDSGFNSEVKKAITNFKNKF